MHTGLQNTGQWLQSEQQTERRHSTCSANTCTYTNVSSPSYPMLQPYHSVTFLYLTQLFIRKNTTINNLAIILFLNTLISKIILSFSCKIINALIMTDQL